MQRGKAQRRAQRQDDGQVGARQDGRHHHEMRQRQPDAALQPQQVQRPRRLGMAGHEDEAQPAQRTAVAQRAGQRVAAAQQHHVALLQQGLALGARQHRQVAEGQVQPALVQRRGDGLGRHLHRLHPHGRGRAAHGRHQQRQELVGADVAHVHDEAALRMRGVEAVGLLQRHVELAQRRLHLARQLVGLGRGRHAAGDAGEQRVVQQQAQPRQRMADGRLRHTQRLRRAADAACRVHGGKHVQQVEVEVADIHPMHGICKVHAMDAWRRGA